MALGAGRCMQRALGAWRHTAHRHGGCMQGARRMEVGAGQSMYYLRLKI